MNRFIPVFSTALMLAGAAPAMAVHAPDHAAETRVGDDLVAGEVRKVDKEAGKVTIKHGPLTALGMPAMTMVFRAKDPAMLDKLKPGDAIRFKAEKIDGNFTVTEYQPAK